MAKCSALKTNKKRAEQGGRGKTAAEIKESGKKEKKRKFKQRARGLSRSKRPPVIFKTQFFPPGIVTESQLRSRPPYLGLHLPGSIAANVTTWLHSNQWNENGSDAASTCPGGNPWPLHSSSSLSHGLFVAVVWPGFLSIPKRIESLPGTAKQQDRRAKQTQPREKAECFWWEKSAGVVRRILFQQLSLNLN